MTSEHRTKSGSSVTVAGRVLNVVERNGLGPYLLTKPLVVAVSGGVDSLALIHLLCDIRGAAAPATLEVAHLNHCLRETAADDAVAVEQVANSLGLRCTTESADVAGEARAKRISIEDAGRQARYRFLCRLAAERRAIICTAHTADDQAETVFMNIARGTGLLGLGGMRMLSPVAVSSSALPPSASAVTDAQIRIFRPLLETWRSELEAYCALRGLEPRADESNTDLRYTRNRVRHVLLPLLAESLNPNAKAALTRLASTAREDDDLLDALAAEALGRVSGDSSDSAIGFDADVIAALPRALGRRVVRLALFRLAGTLDGFTLQHVDGALSVLTAAPNGERAIALPGHIVAERSGRLSYLRLGGALPLAWREAWPAMDPGLELSVSPGAVLHLSDGWSLRAVLARPGTTTKEAGDLVALFDADVLEQLGRLTIRTRRAGDRISPLGLHGRKSLQDLFTDAKIPAEVRATLPLLALAEAQDTVLWVPGPGGRRSALAALYPSTRRILRLEFTGSGRNVADEYGR